MIFQYPKIGSGAVQRRVAFPQRPVRTRTGSGAASWNLARSIGDLQDIIRTVRAKGASLKATEQPIDTSTAAGKCFLDMLGVFAEFETNLRRERQLEGIAKAKAAGVYKGRPASIDVTKVRQLKAKGLGASEIAKALKIGRASVYRVLGERE
jgi:DNA invertase Pin-like site-specific DNA recombinase